MITAESIEKEMVEGCLDELYRASQPSITFNEAIEYCKQHPDIKIYERHYLSEEDYKYIVDKYVDLYNLNDPFDDYCDLLIRDATNGYNVDKYIDPKDGSPGYRSYEKKPSLKEEIGEEHFNKVIEFINSRKNYYRFNRKCSSFRFTMMNYSPTSNKESVIKYWKSQGKDIVIEDRDPKYNYERYELGYSEEEIKELALEEENE